MKVLLYSHKSDIDGMGSVVLGNLVYENMDYKLYRNPNELSIHLENDYKDGLLYEYDLINITDLSPKKELVDILFNDEKLKDKIHIYDHHETALDSGINKYNNVNITIKENNIPECATSIYYKYLLENNLIEKTSCIEKFVEFTRLEDTWTWKEKNEVLAHDLAILYNAIGYEKYIKLLTNKLLTYDILIFSKEELEEINNKKKQSLEKIQLYTKDLFIKEIDNIKVGFCFIGYEYRNEVAEYLKNNNEIDVVGMIALDNNQISLRNIKDDKPYSRIIAEKYHGGGHDNAAAIPITKDIKEKIINTII